MTDVKSMTDVKLKANGTQLLGIGIAGQPLALGFGNVAGANYVSVVTNSGNPYQWQVVSLGTDGRTTKLFIGKPDGSAWWTIPGNDPLPNCVSVVVGSQEKASTIILDNAAQTLSAAFQPGGFLAPIGGPQGFYYATNSPASSPVIFFAIS